MSPQDIVDLISACFENGATSLLLYTENLTEHFFDLSSGEAGPILQKLRQYHMKLAVVLSPTGPQPSTMFRELLKEENKGPHFRVFSDRDAAETWLSGN
jgi:hypothetical protein